MKKVERVESGLQVRNTLLFSPQGTIFQTWITSIPLLLMTVSFVLFNHCHNSTVFVYDGLGLTDEAWEFIIDCEEGTAVPRILDFTGYPSLAAFAVKHKLPFERVVSDAEEDKEMLQTYVNSLPPSKVADILRSRVQLDVKARVENLMGKL